MEELYKTIDLKKISERKNVLNLKKDKGETLGNLFKTRIALEDTISSKGMKTTVGSKMLKDYIPPFDATVVEKLLDEDAIINGKIDVKEFGVGKEIQSNIARVIKLDQADISIGVDACGEMRIEASRCGLYALKPTYGTISRYGVIGSAPSLEQIGIIGRSISDIEKVFYTISGGDERDSTTFAWQDIASKYIKDIKTIKIGLIKEYIEDADPRIKEEIDKTIEELKSLGFSIKYLEIPSVKYAPAIYNILQAAEFSSNMGKFDGVLYGYRTKEYKDTEDFYKKNRTEGFSIDVKKRILFGNFVLSEDNYKDYYEKSQRIRTLITQEVKEGFKEVDILLSPVIEEDSKYTLLANLVGRPSLSLPIEGKEGNIGLQIMGENFSEELLFKLGRLYEKEVLNKIDKEKGGEDHE